jgi:acetyl-CoA carboxylase alpha subunit
VVQGVIPPDACTTDVELRVKQLFDRVEFSLHPSATVLTGRAQLEGRSIVFLATDPRYARGAIGAADADAMIAAMRQAREKSWPMVWFLDSAGAKVDEGLAALGAFRRLYREALLTKSRIPILAVLGRGCYGGASMLAMLANYRLYGVSTRLSTSGPAIIEAIEGRNVFDSRDADAVTTLLGTEARLRFDARGENVGDDISALRGGVTRWLQTPGTGTNWREFHAILGQRLSAYAETTHTVDSIPKIQPLLPPGYTPAQQGNIVVALPVANSGKAVFCGYLTGGQFGAQDGWQLVDVLLGVAQSHPKSPIVLLLDASGHAPRVSDEKVILASYLAQLGECVSDLCARGQKTALWILGSASGAVYVAFAAGVERVSIVSSAGIEVLNARAVDSILRRAVAGASSTRELIELGVADAVLESQLEN